MTPEESRDQSIKKLRKKWALQDWPRDINSYERWKEFFHKYNSEYAEERMKRIKEKYPGKEHLFD